MQRVLRSQADFRTTLLRNQLTSLVIYETVKTTKAKAALLVPFANHFFNRVKESGLPSQRLAHQTLLQKVAVKKLFEEIMPRYSAEETTFVGAHLLGPRRGDGAERSLVSLTKLLTVEKPVKAKKDKTQPKTEATE